MNRWVEFGKKMVTSDGKVVISIGTNGMGGSQIYCADRDRDILAGAHAMYALLADMLSDWGDIQDHYGDVEDLLYAIDNPETSVK